MSLVRTPLQAFLQPRSIAVFGAAPADGNTGRALAANLRAGGYGGKLHIVSAAHEQIDDLACVASLDAIDGGVSLALIAADGEEAVDIVGACAARRVPAAILYGRGFGGSTPAAHERLARLRQAAGNGLRLFGPHAFGIMAPHLGLNLTPACTTVAPGNLALVSQSASVAANILDWSHGDGCGLSGVYVPGLAAGVGLAEILDHLATDPRTECILLYLEGIDDARPFLSALRAAASVKPVIALKTGQSPLSAPIVSAHYGIRTGSDAAFDAAMRRVGVLRVGSVGDMFSAARALTTRTMPRGARLAVVANGGAPAVMAMDELARHRLELASLAPTTLDAIEVLPRADWSTGNPVGILFDAGPERYVAAIDACLNDPGVDAVLAILAPNDRADPLAVARAVVAAHGKAAKPVLACWLGENSVREARMAFTGVGLPVFRTPEAAVIAYSFMVDWVRNQVLLRETPAALSSYVAPDRATACAAIDRALGEGRTRLDLLEAKTVLSAFRIPVTPAQAAASAGEAMQIAQAIGFPVTMKVGGAGSRARRQLRSAPEVALAWREFAAGNAAPRVAIEPHRDRPTGRWLAVAVHTDQLFGPVITLSESGIAADVYDARSLALPPLNPRLADEMLGVPHVARLLGPLRDLPAVAVEPLRELLLRVSELASELPWIATLDIAALVADERDAVVVDVAIELRAANHDPTRYRHMAICPYPAQLVTRETLKDGSPIVLRPVRPEDADPLQEFVRHLSMASKRLRYFSTVAELPQHALARYTQIDYGRQLTLLATREDRKGTTVLGEAQYSILPDGATCDFAIVIADNMAGLGLGKLLMTRLIEAARRQELGMIRGDVAAENDNMLGLMESLDFTVNLTDDPDTVEVVLRLR